jgi:hypothetical protein
MYRFDGPRCVQEISLRLTPTTLEDVVGRATVLQELARLEFNAIKCIDLTNPLCAGDQPEAAARHPGGRGGPSHRPPGTSVS